MDATLHQLLRELFAAHTEIDRLRARIAALEQDEPHPSHVIPHPEAADAAAD